MDIRSLSLNAIKPGMLVTVFFSDIGGTGPEMFKGNLLHADISTDGPWFISEGGGAVFVFYPSSPFVQVIHIEPSDDDEGTADQTDTY